MQVINRWDRFENVYPGVRCDIPAHAYQSSITPNTQWTEEFAQGKEIRDYWQGVARKHKVYQYLRAGQKVQKAEWSPEKGKWKVTIEHVDGENKVGNTGHRYQSR
jgi:cation diffusion facilitator CzcD-associated flavoprotein CzcO